MESAQRSHTGRRGRESRRKNSQQPAAAPSSTYSRSWPPVCRRETRNTAAVPQAQKARSRGAVSRGSRSRTARSRSYTSPAERPSSTAWKKTASGGGREAPTGPHPKRRRKKPARSSPASS